MNDLAQFQPAFNGVNTLLAVSTNIETEHITTGNLKLKGNSSFWKIQYHEYKVRKIQIHKYIDLFMVISNPNVELSSTNRWSSHCSSGVIALFVFLVVANRRIRLDWNLVYLSGTHVHVQSFGSIAPPITKWALLMDDHDDRHDRCHVIAHVGSLVSQYNGMQLKL
jgi:hypothetical protein